MRWRVEQRVELRPQGREAARLDLDQLAVGAHEVDDVAAERDLGGVARPREQILDRRVQRPFAQDADPGHRRTIMTRPPAAVFRQPSCKNRDFPFLGCS